MHHHGSKLLGLIYLVTGITLLKPATAFAAHADYPATVLSQGPVGYWRLNETTAPPIPQVVATNIGRLGNAADGVYTNGAVKGASGAIPSDPANRGASFPSLQDGGSRVRVPYQSEWNLNAPFSVEFWAKPGQTGSLACPASSTVFAGTRDGWLVYQGDSTLGSGNGWYFRLYRSADSTANRSVAADLALDTNTWYHVVGSFDGTNVSLYVNGTLAGSVPLGDTYRPVTDTSAPMTFGARSDTATLSQAAWFSYVGSLDEPAFYTNALNPARILAHYQAGTNNSPETPYRQEVLADAPAGYWQLDEPKDVHPAATNEGSLSSAGDGGYVFDADPGLDGPQLPAFPGFEADNKCVGLDAASGYVSIPALNLDTNTVTFTTWLRRSGDQAPNAAIVLNHLGSTAAGLKFDEDVQELSYNWGDDPATTSFRSGLGIPDDQWVFAALIVTPDHAVLAVQDGAAFNVVTNFAAHEPQPFEYETRIGSDIQNDSLAYRGAIDEVAIFNRSLSVGEVYSQYASAVGGLPPQVFSDPQVSPDQPTTGDPLTLSVDAGGTPPLSYQWRKNGALLLGGTLPVYSVPSGHNTDAGDYDVIITNRYGSITSQVASVTVTPLSPPVIVMDPQSRTLYLGGTASFKSGATGGQLSYQWRKDHANILGANKSACSITGVTGGDGAMYDVVITNSLGSVTSAPATLTVITPAPGSYEDCIVSDSPEAWWRLNEPASSADMLDSFGRHDGVYAGGSPGSPGVVTGSEDTAVTFDGAGYGVVPYSRTLNVDTFSIEIWARTSVMGVEEGLLSSFSSANRTDGRGIGFLKSDSDYWRAANGNNNTPPGDFYPYIYSDLGDLVSGKWTHLAASVSANAVTYYIDGVNYLGTFPNAHVKNISAPLYIGAFQPGGDVNRHWIGDIDEVTFYSRALTAGQIRAHYVAALYGTNSRPIFIKQLASQTVVEGSTAQFAANVEGSVPIQLQWSRNGSPILGATNSTLTLSNVTYTDQGSFVLTATNAVGASNSAPAMLAVVPLPAFANVTNGLVVHLTFDGNCADTSGRTNDASPVGDVSFVPGKLGQALHYSTDSASHIYNYVTLNNPGDLWFSSNVNFSVAYWIRVPSNALTGDLPFLSTAQQSFGGRGYTFAPSYMQGGWSWSLNHIGIYGPLPAINDGQWHHLLHVFDRAASGTTWMDGTLVDHRLIAGAGDLDTGAPTNIGQSGSGHYSESGEADIDDIGIWRRALTAAEAQAIYSSGKNFGRSFDTYGPVSMALRNSGQDLELIWQAGALLESDNLAGPWNPVPGATAPYFKVTPAAGNRFYRVQL